MTTAIERAHLADKYPVKTRKKLIEVALPLEAINIASAREKSIRHGHPSTLHLWWARRPLAAARAVIFSQMVDDPSEYVDVLREDPKLRRKAESILKAKTKLWQDAKELVARAEGTGLDVPEPGPEPTLDEILADQERQRLFRIIEDLVLWENTTNETVLQAARDEIWASWRRTCLDNIDHPRAKELFDRHTLPAFHDPFAGGGALPLEAQRLGLEAYASDLNPVAVLINKAMIEIPPKFAGRPPVNPEARADRTLLAKEWRGAQGLAEDVRYYGEWVRHEAQTRIGHLYPRVTVTRDMTLDRPDLLPFVGRTFTVIAWIWARTVRSPNPAFGHIEVPLASTFLLATKPGKEAYVEPSVQRAGYRFLVRRGKPPKGAEHGTKAGGSGMSFQCLMSGTPIPFEYVRSEGKAGRIGTRLMAVALEGDRGRIYLSPTADMEALAASATPSDPPETHLPAKALGFRVQEYGMARWRDLFTPRQLAALTTFSDLISEVPDRVLRDDPGQPGGTDTLGLDAGGSGATAYAEAVAVYMAFALDRLMQQFSTLAVWSSNPAHELVVNMFARQTMAMTWDFGEVNPFSGAASWEKVLDFLIKPLASFGAGSPRGYSVQADARSQGISADRVVSTDPPYYDNIGYADLSDYFYVWMRRSLGSRLPTVFATVSVPKLEELIAAPTRHGGRANAEAFFLNGMTEAMRRLSDQAHPAFPITIYYAFKQTETTSASGTASTGWETFLDAVAKAGFTISGTWPVRTERKGRINAQQTNSLASSIVLVCRKASPQARQVSRREFNIALKAELPAALAHLQRGNIAPVDLAQAAIGPGMAVYTRYSQVLDALGSPLSVREALELINATLDEALTEQEGDFDPDSRWALAWYEQHGFDLGPAGDAILLSTAKATALNGLEDAGIVESGHGHVRLLRPSELDPTWDPHSDARRPAWQTVHQLILAAAQGEEALASLIVKLGPEADTARELAYRLYILSERKKRTVEAGWYNGLVQSWTEAVRLAAEKPVERPVQARLFGES